MGPIIRLLICDDSLEARKLVRTVLSDHPEIEVVAEAADGKEAVALATELAPDVVLMDVVMPELDGVEATKRIKEHCPAARVVAFTGVAEGDVIQSMLEAGASAYCVKGAPLWELERAIAGANQPLLRLAHTLARSVSQRGVASLVARETAELSGAVVAAVYLASDVGLSLAATAGPGAPSSPKSSAYAAPGVVLRAHAEAEAVHAGGRELVELYRAFNVPCGEALAVPLLVDGDRLGVLLTVMPANVQFEVDIELVRAVADLAAGALASERRLAMTHAEARRDPLTGLGNRRAFEEHLAVCLRKAADEEESVGLVLLDLDDFKETNDTKGHAEGDRTLIAFGRILLGNVRADEEVFRIGGDEFVLVVRGDAQAAAAAAERLRESVHRQRRIEGLTSVSAGIAACPEHAASRDELLEKADAALYAAKRAGKDRVEVHEPGQPPAPRHEPPQLHLVPQEASSAGPSALIDRARSIRILVVDDDPQLRMLLRTTFEIIDIEVDEAGTAAAGEERIAARRPDVIVLDVALPDVDGISLCRKLKSDRATSDIPVVLLTGAAGTTEPEGRAVGADAFIRKPFSPLELLETIERLTGRLSEGPFRLMTDERPDEQLLLYAQDLRRLLEIEHSQRMLLQSAYEETVTALARALESKDIGTGAHSQRVTRYAKQLAQAFDSALLLDPGLEYGFLLHDIGKIGVPDDVLQKSGPLTDAERRVIESHTVLGQQILQRVPLLQGEGLRVIRSHHERWDGRGYPDGLRGDEIPVGARIFSIVDALDAMTTNRPYRKAGSWHAAVDEIVGEAGHQFDPGIVRVFENCEPQLRRIYFELGAA